MVVASEATVMRRSLALLVVPLALAACSPKQDPCTPENQKANALALMRSWYLYPDLIDGSIAPSNPTYATVDDYLWALTAPARAAGKDRGWTYATTYAATQQYYDQGTTVGFGVGFLQRGTQVFVSQVYPSSAAFDAGFARGDEILAVGDTETSLVDVPTLLSGSGFGSALGPSTAGVTRSFQVMPSGGTTAVLRTMTKRTYSLDPVPEGWTVLQQPSGPVGYVALRTFIYTAQTPLEDVFAQFKQAGVQDVIVDLRYNGGGAVDIAQLLANLLAADRAPTDVMFHMQYNASQSRWNQTVSFAPPSQSIPAAPTAPARVAFITTGSTASASEIVPNVLEPYRTGEIALVGATTYGKPVGQEGFALYQCDLAIYLIAFAVTNAENEGGYYQGLPDVPPGGGTPNFSGPLCQAADDLTHATSDPAEASTAAALQWIATGTCPPPPAPAAKLSGRSAALEAAGPVPDAYPSPVAPDPAQRNVRGLF